MQIKSKIITVNSMTLGISSLHGKIWKEIYDIAQYALALANI